VRYGVGRAVVDILDALGLHGWRLFLVSFGLALLIIWVAWRLATFHLSVKKQH
jgi:hypothetical protein